MRPLDWLAAKSGIPRGELRWAAWFAGVVMAATCIPYLYGIAVTPAGSRFMGFIHNPLDNNVYVAWMRQAMEGRWFFKDPFTTEMQPGPGFFNVFFLALGLVARALRMDPVWPYHAARLIFGFLFLVTGYVFAARFSESVPTRRLALALMGLSSGFGWLWTFFPAATGNPLDLGPQFGPYMVVPEAITFLSLLLYPHFAASIWLMLVVYLLLLQAWDTGSRKALLGASVAGLLLANIHTYDVLVIYSVVAAHLLVKGLGERRLPWREAAMAAVVAGVSVWPVVYQYALFRADPVFRAFANAPLESPPGRYVAFGYGLPLLLAVPGAALALVNRRLLFPVVWLVINWLLIAYAPFPFRRRMIEGMHLPICLLAAAFVGDYLLARLRREPGGDVQGLRGCTPHLSPPRQGGQASQRGEEGLGRWAAGMAVTLVALTMPSNAFFLQRAGHDLRTNNADYLGVLLPPLYLTDGEFAGMRWLREHTRPGDAVLCTSIMGSYIPAVAGNTVFVGHWSETLDYVPKVWEVRDFLNPTIPEKSRVEMARGNGLRYLFYSRYERAAGRWFNPRLSPLLKPVYQQAEVSVFRLDLPPQ